MSDAPISYITDASAPEVKVGGWKYAVGCGLSHQLPLISQIGPGAAPVSQPDDFPNFPLPCQPTNFCTVLNESAMQHYTELSISLTDSIALERETREQSTNNLWFHARSPQITSTSYLL
ncbi:hypothetical protein CHARACLAT_013562 [Characodon lateralis]|uniref:Uncharacterized protein n=1 Tax=Characodon lateralis TaxID=208331 RepID=A0ABU7CXF5_9TELE|nr:hypothetical protein [Characodon lateralis]